ncbi:MAG: DNA polymerase I [Formosimonas sp.]
MARAPQTLLLVDGSSFLYRAFHGLPDLRSPSGAPTGALYGMINMLKRLQAQVPTAHALCVFDAKGKTFRDELYPDYKATRSAMPDDLRLQIDIINQAVAALGWPVVAVEGVEADDVMGTLSVQAAARGWHTVMATGDKDLTQLVNEQVLWFNTMSDDILDIKGVTEKFGVPPERIIDYLTLVGDTVDNIPGVAKVGPKTAVKWLTEFGTLDNIVASAAQIGGKVGENLRAALDWLPQGRALVTVKCDVALPAPFDDIATIKMQPADNPTLKTIYEQSNFRTWLKAVNAELEAAANGDLFAAAPAPAVIETIDEPDDTPIALTAYDVQITIVNTPELLQQLLTAINAAQLTAFDCETDSLNPMQAQLVGLSFAVDGHSGWYVPVGHIGMQNLAQLPLNEVLAALQPWLENPHAAKIGQHLKYDQHILANHGLTLRGIAHDTLLQSYVLDSQARHNLGAIAERYLHVSSVSYEELCGKGATQISFAQVEIELAARYAAEDAALCLALHEILYPRICRDSGLRTIYEQIELPTSQVLFGMERTGVWLDVPELQAQSHHLGQQQMSLEHTAHELAGQPFNLNSPKQLGEIFFDKLGLPVIKKTAKGAASTDEDVLQKLAEDYPLPKVLLEYRGLAKLKSTYTDKLPLMVNPRTQRVHTHYAQAVAVTGRLSSNDPNLQNIPIKSEQGRLVRKAFVAAQGCVLMSADYSQIELRILAHLSQDSGLCAAFKNNEDVHQRTAAQIFGCALTDVTSEQRRMAKMINFGLIYGMSAFGLANNLGISRTAAQQYMDSYFTQYPSVLQYMESTKQFAREHGYVQTHFGRRLYLSDINHKNQGKRQGAERAAINAPMQGTSADLIKLAMIALQNTIDAQNLRSRLILQVHDELILEVPSDEVELMRVLVPQTMASVVSWDIPLLAEVGVGSNWDEAH